MLFFEEFPYTADAYPSEWIGTLQAAEALAADIFVPGHGFLPAEPRDTRQGLVRHRQILLDVRAAVEKEVARGATPPVAISGRKGAPRPRAAHRTRRGSAPNPGSVACGDPVAPRRSFAGALCAP